MAPKTTRAFPNPVAIFSDMFVFTTLDERGVAAHARIPYGHPGTGASCLLFSLDEEMRYTPFAKDHGPLNLAYSYAAFLRIHDRLERAEARHKPVCLYTTSEPKAKSNMALIVALYALTVKKEAPWNAFKPIANMEVMPFRDAGNGPMDHGLSIQDILYGVDKAITNDLLSLADFDLDAYQYYETVNNGDLNVLGPFIPFASPVEDTWIKAVKRATKSITSPAGSVTTITTTSVTKARVMPHSMKCVFDVFEKENVGLVIRLNDELYDRRHFIERGMEHIEMYFDDGTNPSDDIVRDFIKLAEDTIGRGQKVAVHCKAGLGRTGVLIGAYLIYKYHFSAQEVIGYMRIIRPGMVVGPQQQYMAMNQMKWAGWAARDELLRELAAEEASQEPINPLATPPIESTPLFSAIEHASGSPYFTQVVSRLQSISSTTMNQVELSRTSVKSPSKGGDAVGQPRKTPARPISAARSDPPTPPEQETDDHAQSSSDTASQTLTAERGGHFDEADDRTSPSLKTSAGSMRGTKRGAGRTPLLDIVDRTRSAPPQVTISASKAALSRSLSNASTSSSNSADHDPRPPKRRTAANSPLSKIGLSSPPPSRETTPASPVPEECMKIEIDESRPTQLRVPNKLRRRGSPCPSIMETSTPPPTSTLTSSQESGIPPDIASPSPTRALPKRSFLPVRRNGILSSFMDPKAISLVEGPRVTRSGTSGTSGTSGIARISSPRPAKEQSLATPRRIPAPSARKVGLTPPRITGMWGQLSKMGSSSPTSASGC